MKNLFESKLNIAKDIEQNGVLVSQVLDKIKGLLPSHDHDEFIARESSSITLATVREGAFPCILVINGYLSQEGKYMSDWLSVVDELYPKNKIVHVRWNAGNVTDIALDDSNVAGDMKDTDAEKWLAAATLARDMSPADIATLVGEIVTDKFVGHWNKSFNETLHAGDDLAKAIQDDDQLQGAILMGYSLGTVVACQALSNLDANKVTACYLLAGAVSAETEQWTPILEKHTDLCLINCYSDNDDVLKSAYGAGSILDHKPAGLTEIDNDNTKQVVNLNVTEFSSGHLNIKNEKVGKALAGILKP
ncbi:hypothetical protein AKG98_4026 [Moritella sp. JT01]|uniref:DUF726 domain-containing protein n=1 Tax=Moritella sp. JT01 TaxID=756698 RepID=UPI000799A736|nr:DUF726 domain-containing protein [Moritella sp. JT01]KXO12830.1 hypothetical protein AKG98_4026 [Moritella sp. JT01]